MAHLLLAVPLVAGPDHRADVVGNAMLSHVDVELRHLIQQNRQPSLLGLSRQAMSEMRPVKDDLHELHASLPWTVEGDRTLFPILARSSAWR